jgi:hypothetical protein
MIKVLKSNKLIINTIKEYNEYGELTDKIVFVNDQGNIIDENYVKYTTEQYLDENGIKQYKHIPVIKDEIF